MTLPNDPCGRLACIIAGLFFGFSASWLLVALFMRGGFRVDRLWVLELVGMFATFGWGLFLWGIAMPSWITRIVEHATLCIMIAIMALFLPIAFEFLLFGIQGKLP